MDLHILIGLPASGKSTYAEKHQDENTEVFSSDKYRESHPGITHPEVFNYLHKNIKQALQNGHDCIFDATNLSRKHRIELITSVRKYADAIVAHLFLVPMHVCIERNEHRENKHEVTPDVIHRMISSFQPPWYSEGFDEIIIHMDTNIDTNDVLGYTTEDLNDFDQKNHHHKFTVGVHEQNAEKYILEHYMFTEHLPFLQLAARHHDDGKLFTQTFINMKGEQTEEAHYYGHECVSAYLFLLRAYYCADTLGYPLTDWGKLYVSNLIAYHMRPIVWQQSSKAKKRDTDVLGNEMIHDIMCINKADFLSHFQ